MSSELRLRIVSASVLAATALAAAWLGGVLLFLFWLIGATGVLVEWWRMTGGRLGWRFLGVLYATAVIVSPVVLRLDPAFGFAVLVWLFAVVWGSDVMAYACGRLIGGPKLMPSVSPKKTWAGFIGGTLFAALAGTAVAAFFAAPSLLPVAAVSLLGAVVSQGGDLVESAIKRRFGVKDAGSLIPGHGGFMDRLDGFIAAGLFALVLGVARGGWTGAAQGVLIW
jgi:phosphatidate cytidylyltransferase